MAGRIRVSSTEGACLHGCLQSVMHSSFAMVGMASCHGRIHEHWCFTYVLQMSCKLSYRRLTGVLRVSCCCLRMVFYKCLTDVLHEIHILHQVSDRRLTVVLRGSLLLSVSSVLQKSYRSLTTVLRHLDRVSVRCLADVLRGEKSCKWLYCSKTVRYCLPSDFVLPQTCLHGYQRSIMTAIS